jgi:hypothetical protein
MRIRAPPTLSPFKRLSGSNICDTKYILAKDLKAQHHSVQNSLSLDFRSPASDRRFTPFHSVSACKQLIQIWTQPGDSISCMDVFPNRFFSEH